MYGIIIALVILICILFLPIRAELLYKEKARLKVSFSGIPVYKKTLEKGEKKKEAEKEPQKKVQKLEENSQKLGEKIDSFREFYKLATKLLNRYVKLDEITMKVVLGTGDAPTTAISTGALWGVLYGLIGRIGTICEIKRHNVEITPNYNSASFSFEGKCIIKSSIAYIIIIAITILMKIKSRKGKEE